MITGIDERNVVTPAAVWRAQAFRALRERDWKSYVRERQKML
jgi:hypothetical protein